MRDKLIELLVQAEKIAHELCIIRPCSDECLVNGFCTDTVPDKADYLIANGVTLQQWIPVSERLPEKTGWYRVCHKSNLISDRYFYSDSPEAFARFGSDPVTHWKPIEEPPKEGE